MSRLKPIAAVGLIVALLLTGAAMADTPTNKKGKGDAPADRHDAPMSREEYQRAWERVIKKYPKLQEILNMGDEVIKERRKKNPDFMRRGTG